MNNKPSSRVEYWSEYREKINEKSRKFEHPFDNSKTLSKIAKEIKAINPKILDDFKINQIKTPELIKIKENNENYFDSISFQINNFDHSSIKKIDNELKFASNSIVSNLLIDENGLVELSCIDKSNSIEELEEIKNKICDVEKIIQVFPKDSKKDLEKLTLLVRTANNNTKEQKIEEFSFNESNNVKLNKKIYLSFIIILFIVLLIIFALLITFVIV